MAIDPATGTVVPKILGAVDDSGINLDESLWPVVIFTPGALPTCEDYVDMFAQYRCLYVREQRFYTVTDASYTTAAPDAATRKRIAQLTKQQEENCLRWVVGAGGSCPAPPSSEATGLHRAGPSRRTFCPTPL